MPSRALICSVSNYSHRERVATQLDKNMGGLF